MLDEPLSALDTHLRSQMEAQLQETFAAYRRPALLVTHNIEEAYRLGARLLVLSRGRVAALGAKGRIFRRPPTVEVARLTGCKNISRARAHFGHSVEALDWGCALRVAHPLAGRSPASSEFAPITSNLSKRTVLRRGKCLSLLARAIVGNALPHHAVLDVCNQPSAQSPQPVSANLQAEVFKEKWQRFRDRPFPWHVRLSPDSLFWMPE